MNGRDSKFKTRTTNGEIYALSAVITEAMQEKFTRVDFYRSCISCKHFDICAEHCTFQGCNARPPALVIASGCDSYEDDNEIPF